MNSASFDTALIKQKAIELGFDQCGVCAASQPEHYEAYARWLDRGFHGTMGYLRQHLPLKEHPEKLLPGARSVIAVTLNYYQPSMPEEKRRHGELEKAQGTDDRPRIARYALGRDYHRVLRGKLRRLSAWLTELHPEARHRACVDSAPIMERDFAQAAGLGWYGKNTMLIDSKRGSWFFIGLLLTTLDLNPDQAAVGGCGTCTRCVDACPTGAIVLDEKRWQVDARRCISYLTIEHRGEIDPALDTAGWVFGCDVCQEVCPFNEPRPSQPLRGVATTEPDLLATQPWPSAEVLSELPYEGWDSLTRGSAVRRAGHEGLKRNARIALNVKQYEAPAT
ncbi:MAG: tRNA epoxyqueuosine(34) reductase QueG [Fimbriimonadaceae bacterium]